MSFIVGNAMNMLIARLKRGSIIFHPVVEIMRSVYLKGTSIAELWVNYAALGGFAVFFCCLAALTYKKQQ